MNTHTHINLNDEQNFLRRYNLSGTECIPNSRPGSLENGHAVVEENEVGKSAESYCRLG